MIKNNVAKAEPCFFIRLKTHIPVYSGPPIFGSGLVDEIAARRWNLDDVEFENGDLRFYHEHVKAYYDSIR